MPTYHAFHQATQVHPFLTVQTAAGEYAVLRMARYFKISTAAAVVERAFVQRYNSGGVTATNRTEKKNTRSATATAPGQSWGTGPAAVGNPLILTDVGDKPAPQNAWRPPRPYAGIYLVDADEVGIDANSTTNTSTAMELGWVEQDPGTEDREVRGRRPRKDYWSYYNHCSTGLGGKGVTTVPKRNLRSNYCAELKRGARWNVNKDYDLLLLIPPGGLGATIGLVTETDSLFALSKLKTRAVGLVLEADTALAMTRKKSRLLGIPLETDSALALLKSKARTLNLVSEVDSSLALARKKARLLGLPLETDSTPALTRLKTRAIGLVSESDIALSLGRGKAKLLGLISETDLALPFQQGITRLLGLVTETDEAVSLLRIKAKTLGITTETDSILGLSKGKLRNIGLIQETNIPQGISKAKTRALGLITEVNTALHITRVGVVSAIKRIGPIIIGRF